MFAAMASKPSCAYQRSFTKAVGRALRRAARAARMEAKAKGTVIAVMKDGKVVLVKP
jgi:hypothetical protein